MKALYSQVQEGDFSEIPLLLLELPVPGQNVEQTKITCKFLWKMSWITPLTFNKPGADVTTPLLLTHG